MRSRVVGKALTHKVHRDPVVPAASSEAQRQGRRRTRHGKRTKGLIGVERRHAIDGYEHIAPCHAESGEYARTIAATYEIAAPRARTLVEHQVSARHCTAETSATPQVQPPSPAWP